MRYELRRGLRLCSAVPMAYVNLNPPGLSTQSLKYEVPPSFHANLGKSQVSLKLQHSCTLLDTVSVIPIQLSPAVVFLSSCYP